MDRVNELIAKFEDIAQHPGKSVRTLAHDTGKSLVGCFPYYLPEEIIYASGMLPVGLWGGQTEIMRSDQYLQSFCCSIMRANMEFGMKGVYDHLAAVMIPAYCDTLKCIMEDWKVAVPQLTMIPVVYPQNRKILAGQLYLQEELNRIKKELEKIAGKTITEQDMLDSIDIYEAFREAMQQFALLVPQYPITINAKVRHLIIKASYFSDKKQYTEALLVLIDELKKRPKESFRGVKAVLTGILAEPDILLDALVENHIAVVADDLAQETRQFRTLTPKEGSALERLSGRMADQSCSLLYDDGKNHGELLANLVSENDADCVIVTMMKFCDPEEFDYPIYKKELESKNIPMLYLEIEQQMDSAEQIKTRIQAFSEMMA